MRPRHWAAGEQTEYSAACSPGRRFRNDRTEQGHATLRIEHGYRPYLKPHWNASDGRSSHGRQRS
jgi:hypothetical protein